MGMDRRKVAVMAGVLCAMLGVACVVVFGTRTQQPASPRPAPDMPATAAPAAQPLAWATLPMPLQPQPAVMQSVVRIARDPFTGGPGLTDAQWKQRERERLERERQKRLLAEIKVFELSGVSMTRDRVIIDRGPGEERTTAPPAARYCGYICAENGQVWAVIEESTGRARSIRLGDEIHGGRVKAITPEHLLLEDAFGHRQALKFSTQAYDSRGVVVDAR